MWRVLRIGDEERAEHLPQDDRDFLNGASWLCNDPKAKKRRLEPKPAADLKVIAAVANFQQAKVSSASMPCSLHAILLAPRIRETGWAQGQPPGKL